MNGSTITRDTGVRLAAFIEDRRRSIVSTVSRSAVLPRPGSLAANVFTNGFLDRLCQELDVGDRDVVDVWADTETGPDEAFEHARIVVMTCAVISSSFVADCGHSDEVVSFLALRGSELEKRLRAERRPGAARVDPSRMVSKDEVVFSLLTAVEARDSATCEHSRAVGMWCGRLAKTLGLSPDQQAFAALAGTLHDVGKIATPTEILLKPGPLTDEEWEVMRSHSRVGARMLERIPSLRELAPVVLAHHERVDGRGYPGGLLGGSIPIAARIVAVADAFHAMISKRPYRDPLPVPRALEELRAHAGTQFDPLAVDAMFVIVQPSSATARTLRVVRGGR